MSLKPLFLGLAGAALATGAYAGTTGCRFENGVVVVPAEVAGVAGDFILDTGAARTVIAETQAQGAGFAEPAFAGEVRFAGERIAGVALTAEKIDVRTGLFPTPIAGVIGMDVLKAYVVDLALDPCRLRVSAPGKAGPFRAEVRLPLAWIDGAPAVRARASDGVRAQEGAFVVATGSDTAVRVSDAVATAPGASRPRELYPYGVLRPRLRALSVAGDLAQDLPAGLIQVQDPVQAGEIGAPLLWAWRLRFDFPARRLLLAPKHEGPGSRRGPR